MNRDWLQVVSNVAIVIGLGVVIYELDQNHQHVRAELVFEDYKNNLAHHLALLGDDPAAAIAVARVNPEELSEEQKIIVNAHFAYAYSRLSSMNFTADLGIFNANWKDVVPVVFETTYNYPYAKTWWADFRKTPRPWNRELDLTLERMMLSQTEAVNE